MCRLEDLKRMKYLTYLSKDRLNARKWQIFFAVW